MNLCTYLCVPSGIRKAIWCNKKLADWTYCETVFTVWKQIWSITNSPALSLTNITWQYWAFPPCFEYILIPNHGNITQANVSHFIAVLVTWLVDVTLGGIYPFPTELWFLPVPGHIGDPGEQRSSHPCTPRPVTTSGIPSSRCQVLEGENRSNIPKEKLYLLPSGGTSVLACCSLIWPQVWSVWS